MVRLFNHYFPSGILFQILFDAVLMFAAILFGSAAGFEGSVLWREGTLLPALVFALLMTMIISTSGLYRRDQPRAFGCTARRVLGAFLLGLPVLYGIFEYFPCDAACPGPRFFSNAILALTGILLLRAIGFADRGIFSRRILVVGAAADALSVEEALAFPGIPGMHLTGFYPLGEQGVAISRHRLLAADRPILETARRLKADEIIVAAAQGRHDAALLEQLLACRLEGLNIVDLATFFERTLGEVRLDTLRASWLIYSEGCRQGVWRSRLKRATDLLAALLLLAVSAPVMLLTAIAIRLESRGPILYRQERVGLAGSTFRVMKFRSMHTDAEADGKPRWAQANDSRITRVGRFIRRTRIDELPQIFNVLAGDMSLVGPRPERPFFVAQLTREIPFYGIRHSVKPGITGWAQVRYKYGATVEDAIHKLQFDLYYVKNHSLLLDLVILFKTISVVLAGEGAH